jgi:hypothetical protein
VTRPAPASGQAEVSDEDLMAANRALRYQLDADDAFRVAAEIAAERRRADEREQALVAAVEELHRPWYEVDGVRHDHTVNVPCYEFAGCDGDVHHDCDASDGDGHEVPACSECRWSDGDVDGYLLWPCPTIRTVRALLAAHTAGGAS